MAPRYTALAAVFGASIKLSMLTFAIASFNVAYDLLP
jgi:hypothetical protein